MTVYLFKWFILLIIHAPAPTSQDNLACANDPVSGKLERNVDSKRIYALYYSVFCASDRPWVAWLPWKLPWNALVRSSTCAHTSEHTRQMHTPFAAHASSAVLAFRDLFIVARSPCGCPGSNSLTHTPPFTPRNGDHKTILVPCCGDHRAGSHALRVRHESRTHGHGFC